MAQTKSAFEIFRLLDKSNCRECGEKTCLAFAGAVFTGQRKLRECPRLNPERVDRFEREAVPPHGDGQNPEDRLGKLKSEMVRLDLAEAAERVGARLSGGKLSLKILGKDFSVDAAGNLSAEIHINPWVAVP
ncbi:MAG: Fe-S cluster protein, partial [Deltaproteobacteria bacterium]|nr:Fe-S cluster protein [Deltaproteobacteria bacterium]